MPQIVKGGKWVFAWVVVGRGRQLTIPPEAWSEYGFKAGEEAIFLPGSRRSGGFGLTTPRLMNALLEPMRAGMRVQIRERFNAEGQLTLPPELSVKQGDRLLAVRGSGRALGFVAKGPIYVEALAHPEIQVFGASQSLPPSATPAPPGRSP